MNKFKHPFPYSFVINVELDVDKYNATFHEDYETPGEIIYTVAEDLVEAARIFFNRADCGVNLWLNYVSAKMPSREYLQATCTTCGVVYDRERAAPSGPERTHNYCPDCKENGAAARFLKQQQRKRKKDVDSK